MKRIVLCADDYGQAPSISKAIIQLIAGRRLSASSCMVNSAYWPEHAQHIIPFRHQVDIGLHLNFTEGVALSKQYIDKYGKNLMPLPLLLIKSMAGRLSREAVEGECHAQIERFMAVAGFVPSFIDGHQHVHQFPIIRESLMNAYRALFIKKKPYVRWVRGAYFSKELSLKKWIIHYTGGNAFQHLLEHFDIPYNKTFAGIYTFSKAHHYERLFTNFLRQSEDRGIIMCHPGLPGGLEDKISHARAQEYAFLMGPRFSEICLEQGVTLSLFEPSLIPSPTSKKL